jgi:hypothetical protein
VELVYSVEYRDSRTKVVAQQKKGDPGKLIAYVVDPEGQPIEDIEVTFGWSTSYRRTDADGLAAMDVVDMLATTPGSDGHLTSIDMITLKRPGTSTTLRIDEPQANWFNVVYDGNPPEHKETRTDTYAVRGDDLEVLGPAGASGPRVLLKRVKAE